MDKPIFVFASILYSVGFGFSDVAIAQKWADLTMTVHLDGEVPKRKALPAIPLRECGPMPVVMDDLVVDPETKGIANMVFMIDPKRMAFEKGQLHPDLQNVPNNKPVMETINCMFVPHVVAIRAGQTLVSKNRGLVGHNAKFNFFKNDETNPMIPAGADREIAIQAPEPGPTKVECSIHPWMSGYLIVTDHPYVGISDGSGKIKIDKLPAGIALHFKLWHESQDRSIDEVSIGGKTESWRRETVTLTLKEGVNDLGVLLIKPKQFKSTLFVDDENGTGR